MRQRPTSRKRAARIAEALPHCDWATPELEELAREWVKRWEQIPEPDEEPAG